MTPIFKKLIQKRGIGIVEIMENSPLVQKYGRTLEPGQVVFQEGDEGEHMFIIQDGQVQISRKIAGRETPVAVLEKGDFFGEMAIVNRIRRTASATALANTVLLAFDRLGLEQLVEKNPKIALNIIDKLCKRLASANQQILQMASKSSQRSLLIALQVMSQKEEGMGTVHQIQEELGMTLQCPHEEVHSTLQSLIDDGVLAMKGDLVTVKDKKRLHSLADQIS